jgi:DNA-binding MarR family transcriptional regulator
MTYMPVRVRPSDDRRRTHDFSAAAPGRPVSFVVTESGRAALREAVSIVGATGQDILAVLPRSTVESTAEAMQTLALLSV